MSFRSDLEMLRSWVTPSMTLSRCVEICARSFHRRHDEVIKWNHFPSYRSFARGIHRSPPNSPHKGQWRGSLMCSLICAWINGWVNNREAGDLTHHRAHYDVTVINQHCSTGQERVCDFHWVIIRLLLIKSASTTNRTRASFTCWHSKEEYVKINENFLTLDATATACSCSISWRVLITGKFPSKQQHSNVRDPFAYTCLFILLPVQQHHKLLIYTATIIRVWLRFWHHLICNSSNTSKCFLISTLMTRVRGIVYLKKCSWI